MKLKIEINLDNAAFEDGQSGSEVARILHNLANRVEGETCAIGDIIPLIDVNGNRVGQAKVTRSNSQ